MARLKRAGIRTLFVPGLQRDLSVARDFSGFLNLVRLIRSERPDVIHLNSSKAGVLGAIAAATARLLMAGWRPRVVFTAHGWAFNEAKSSLRRLGMILSSRISVWFLDRIVTVSRYDSRRALALGVAPRSKLMTVHNALPPSDGDLLNRADARRRLQRLAGGSSLRARFVVGCVSELTANKGLVHIINAAARLRASPESFRFRIIIIGGGEDRSYLAGHIAALRLGDVVSLAGFVPNAASLLRGFDAFALPSLKEGLPYVILEAARAGLPIIATGVGGIPEIMRNENNGLLVPPSDPASLASSMCRLMRDARLRERLTRQALRLEGATAFRRMLNQTIRAYQ